MQIPESLLFTLAAAVAASGGTWAVMRYRGEEAHKAALAAHRRIDEQALKLVRVEGDQGYQRERFEEAIDRIEGSFRELKGSVDKLVQSGLHCSHCDHGGTAG